MIIKKYIIIGAVFFNLACVYGQKIDNDSLVKSIKKDVTSFFIKKGILQNDVVKNNVDYVTIIEIKDEKVVGYNINGIYSIGVYQSHSQKHILLKEKSIYKILDIKQIDIALKEVIDYSVRNNLNDNTMLFYVKKIIQIYDDNYNHKSVMINKK